MAIEKIRADLEGRGFTTSANGLRMEYAMGSIAHYVKCTVFLHPYWGDIAGEWFFSVRYESFAESAQPELDHHTISEFYLAESAVSEYMRKKGILTHAEIEARTAERRARLAEMRKRRG